MVLMSGLYSGIAESRQTQNQTRVIDIGHMIMLDVPSHRPQWMLQDLIERMASTTRPHASIDPARATAVHQIGTLWSGRPQTADAGKH